jgi:hypothetical protein
MPPWTQTPKLPPPSSPRRQPSPSSRWSRFMIISTKGLMPSRTVRACVIVSSAAGHELLMRHSTSQSSTSVHARSGCRFSASSATPDPPCPPASAVVDAVDNASVAERIEALRMRVAGRRGTCLGRMVWERKSRATQHHVASQHTQLTPHPLHLPTFSHSVIERDYEKQLF